MFEDKTLQCADCGANFTFSARDQEFYQNKGFVNTPKRCPSCRQAKKTERGGGAGGADRQMFTVKCAQCGNDARVPFEPRGSKPVYCSDCYRQLNNR